MFASAAMLLASVGLYSLISLVVTARTREIGVRIALGANRTQIIRLIFAGAAQLLVAGIAAGSSYVWNFRHALGHPPGHISPGHI